MLDRSVSLESDSRVCERVLALQLRESLDALDLLVVLGLQVVILFLEFPVLHLGALVIQGLQIETSLEFLLLHTHQSHLLLVFRDSLIGLSRLLHLLLHLYQLLFSLTHLSLQLPDLLLVLFHYTLHFPSFPLLLFLPLLLLPTDHSLLLLHLTLQLLH